MVTYERVFEQYLTEKQSGYLYSGRYINVTVLNFFTMLP